MENKDTLTIHLSDNGKMPLINDVENYEASWDPNLILLGNCLQVNKGILEGAYKNVEINIHIEEADEVAYTETTIITGIHLHNINYIGSSSGKILTTIEYKGQMVDFICDSIIRMKEFSLYFRNPLLTEYELLWSKEQKLRFERENEVYKYFTSKSISLDLHSQYLGEFLPFDNVNIIQIEPYNIEDTSEKAIGVIDKITLVVSKLNKNIFCLGKGWRVTYVADKYFKSISSLQHFLEDLKSRKEYELSLIDNNFRQPQFLLKGKDGKAISFSNLCNLGFNFKIEKDDIDTNDDGIDWKRESWYAMTDGQYGEMPDGFDGDYDDLGL